MAEDAIGGEAGNSSLLVATLQAVQKQTETVADLQRRMEQWGGGHPVAGSRQQERTSSERGLDDTGRGSRNTSNWQQRSPGGRRDQPTYESQRPRQQWEQQPRQWRPANDQQRQRDDNARCGYCGWNAVHTRRTCPASGCACRSCGGVNHFARVCRRGREGGAYSNRGQRNGFRNDYTPTTDDQGQRM